MEIHATRFQVIMKMAIAIADPIFDEFEKQMGDDMTEEAFIEFLNAISLIFKLAAARTRATTCADRNENTVQVLKEDHMKRRITIDYLLRHGFLESVQRDHPEVMAFFKETDFLEYPETLMKNWRTDVTVVDGNPSDLTQ